MVSNNLIFHFSASLRNPSHDMALVHEAGQFTGSDLDRISNQLAHGLVSQGVKPGDHVAVFLPDIPETIIAFLGILKAGAVYVSLSGSLKERAVGQILENSQPRVLITTPQLRKQVPAPPFLKMTFTTGPGSSLETLINQNDTVSMLQPVASDHPALILYTSGTTGVPKGVTHSHHSLIANMKQFSQCIGIEKDDRVLWFLPLSHAYALNAVLGVCFYTGASIYLIPGFQSQKVVHWIANHGITMIFGVPANYAMLLKQNSDMAGVRLFYSSGASFPVPLSRQWREKFGRPVHQSYGLSECGICTYQYPDSYEHGSLGRVIEPMEIKVVDPESGRELPHGQQGELAIRGPNVMTGYWKRPEENAAALRDRWYHSGDIGVRGERGDFKLLDRLKLVVNIGGYKVIPAEVENVLNQHPQVEDAAVFGAPDPVLGEQVRAAVIPRDPRLFDQAELIAFCAGKLASHQVPGKIVVVETIPRTALGKMRKHLLKEPETGECDGLPLNYGRIISFITQWLTPRLETTSEPLSLNNTFDQLGVTSVQAVTMIHQLNACLGTREEPTILWRFSSIHALATHLAGPAPQPEEDLDALSHEQFMERLMQETGEAL